MNVRHLLLGSLSSLIAFAVACSSNTNANTPANDTVDQSGSDSTGTDDTSEEKKEESPQAPEIGTGDHSAKSVSLKEIVTEADGATIPRDLAFNTRIPDELWVVNNGDNGTVIVHNSTDDEARTAEHRIDGYAIHFMANPAAIDFGADETTIGKPGTFATCGESRNTYGGDVPLNDFMGPVLWSSDLSVYAKEDPIGLGSHLDMLHHTPLCMGIAHDVENKYWVVGGLSKSIGYYDFKLDHKVGQDDHSDGDYREYVTGEIGYVEGIPSHIFYDKKSSTLYIADTGNSRVGRLDTSSATEGAALPMKEKIDSAIKMEGATVVDIVTAKSKQLTHPSGIELYNDLLYVSDTETSRISAFTLKGKRVNYLDTGLPKGSLAGMAFGPDKKLYIVDMIGNRVLRVDPKK